MGYLYHRKYAPPGQTYKEAKAAGELIESRIWWAKWYADGRPRRESTRTEKHEEAKRFLKTREGAAATGQPVLPRLDRIAYDEVAKDLRTHYETTGCRNLKEADGRLAPLKQFFAGRRVASIGPADVKDYVAQRQGSGIANGTINRELAVLLRMLRLAYEHGKLARVPVIRKLKEAPPRQGFFERERYDAVRARLLPDLRVATDLAYAFGWRVRNEVLTLERRQIDLKAGTIRLDPGTTKNDDGRLVFLTPTLTAALAEQLDRVDAFGRKLGRIIPFVFPHYADGPRNPKTGQRRYVRGDRRKDFRKAWGTARKRAGSPASLRHDFRRTAVRDIVNDGTPEKVAMMITGHKTRSVFDRYHIVAPEDLKAATARIAARPGHSSGHSNRDAR
jgi:integrase